MASSIEGRTPLLDPKLVDFVLRLPHDYLMDPVSVSEKKVLYDAFEDMLPPPHILATKQPLSTLPWHIALFDTDAGQELKAKYLSR
jgi:asparagine synthase (glutamine-hydrolysing)